MSGQRSALIVANHTYEDPDLHQLRAPAQDAEALGRVLGDPQIGDFTVRTVLDQPSYVISEAIEEFFAEAATNDFLLLHFSGHGVKDEDGQLYLGGVNTKLRRLGATAIPAEFLTRQMRRSRCRRIVLLLDCCYSGAFERGMNVRAGTGMNIKEQFAGRGRAVITASSAIEYAFEGRAVAQTSAASPSVFTSAVVQGLETGDADRDGDGQVGLDELYDYVYDQVLATTPNQTPGKWVFDGQGDLIVARRARQKPSAILPRLSPPPERTPEPNLWPGLVAASVEASAEEPTPADSQPAPPLRPGNGSGTATVDRSELDRTVLSSAIGKRQSSPAVNERPATPQVPRPGDMYFYWRKRRRRNVLVCLCLAVATAIGIVIAIPDAADKPQIRLAGKHGGISAVAFSADGKSIATGATDAAIEVWNLQSRKVALTLDGSKGRISTLAFSSSTNMLAAGTGDGIVQVWDISTRKLISTLPAGSGKVTSLAFARDGRSVVASNDDRSVRIWRLPNSTPVNVQKSIEANRVLFSPTGGDVLLQEANGIKSWNLLSNTIRPEYPFPATAFAYTKDGKGLQVSDSQSAHRWRLGAEIPSAQFVFNGGGSAYEVDRTEFSADGSTLVVERYSKNMELWDTATGKKINEVDPDTEADILSIAVSQNGELLASGDGDGTVQFWRFSR